MRRNSNLEAGAPASWRETMSLPTTAVRTAAALACGAVLALAAAQPAPAGQPPDTGAGAPATSPDPRAARALLMRMADYLSRLPAYSVRIESNYDVVQASGQKIEFGERRQLILQRPNRLRVDTERSDGHRTVAVFSGTELALVDLTGKVYASAPQPGVLDESILHLVTDLRMRLPLAMLLMSRLPLEFERRVRSVDYVEKTSLFGVPAHHLAARGDTADMQVWLSDSAQPLPLRIVLTYKDEPGQPEFRAQFADWNVTPAIADTTFRVPIPAGAQKVLFAAQLAAARAARQGAKP
jgi:hypothetical protein